MPQAPVQVARGLANDDPRIRRLYDFMSDMVQPNGDFLLFDITIGRGGDGDNTNSAFGKEALTLNAGGQNNTAVGISALAANTSGDNNTALGKFALTSNTTADGNTGVGRQSLSANTTGAGNTAVGNGAYENGTTGSNNVVIGSGAAGFGLEDPENSVYIGAICRGADTDSNTIVIGFGSITKGANTTVIGNTSTTKAYIYGLQQGVYKAHVAKTANYTVTGEDYAIYCDASSGAFTITLRAAASSDGQVLNIKKTDSSGNSVTIDGNGSETIDGATTATLTTQYESVTIHCDGSTWWIL